MSLGALAPPCLVWPHRPQAGPRGRRAPRSHCTACRGLIVIADVFCAINNLGVMIKMTTVGWKARLAVASAVEEFLRRDPLPQGVLQCPCNWEALLASLPADYLVLAAVAFSCSKTFRECLKLTPKDTGFSPLTIPVLALSVRAESFPRVLHQSHFISKSLPSAGAVLRKQTLSAAFRVRSRTKVHGQGPSLSPEPQGFWRELRDSPQSLLLLHPPAKSISRIPAS